LIFDLLGGRCDSGESDEELSLLGDTIVREALHHAADNTDIRDTDSVTFKLKLTFCFRILAKNSVIINVCFMCELLVTFRDKKKMLTFFTKE
jgi:hypothetical protein